MTPQNQLQEQGLQLLQGLFPSTSLPWEALSVCPPGGSLLWTYGGAHEKCEIPVFSHVLSVSATVRGTLLPGSFLLQEPAPAAVCPRAAPGLQTSLCRGCRRPECLGRTLPPPLLHPDSQPLTSHRRAWRDNHSSFLAPVRTALVLSTASGAPLGH